MATISYDKKCNKNKDCKSNVCEMIYQNSKPVGIKASTPLFNASIN